MSADTLLNVVAMIDLFRFSEKVAKEKHRFMGSAFASIGTILATSQSMAVERWFLPYIPHNHFILI